MSDENPTEKITPVPQNRFDTMYGRLDDRVSELEDERDKLWEIVEDQAETIEILQSKLETQATSKTDKLCSIVDAADTKRDPGQEQVALDWENVQVATGCSRRYAYDLIDDFGDIVPFAQSKNKESVTGHADKPKRIIIDFDGREKARLKAIVRRSSQGGGE